MSRIAEHPFGRPEEIEFTNRTRPSRMAEAGDIINLPRRAGSLARWPALSELRDDHR